MGNKLILHILILIGRFKTEVDITMHRYLREAIWYENFIDNE